MKALSIILETEKLVVYAIFSMILILSSLNIFFLLIMMSVEKTRDISILYSIGVKRNTVKNTFILQGVLIGMSGVLIGLFFGIMISFLQQETGFVKINLPNSIINAYPVKIEAYDVFLITIIVLIISSIASIFPSIITAITIVLCMYALSLVMKNIPMGITYASFAGLTIIATVIVGVIKYNQVPNLYSIIGLALIIIGVLMVNLLGNK